MDPEHEQQFEHQHEEEEAVYLDPADAQEEYEKDQDEPMSEGEDEFDGDEAGPSDQQQPDENDPDVVFVDESVQGFFGHTDSVYSIHINPANEDLVVSGGGDDLAYVWNARTGDTVYKLTGHTDSITAARFSNDGQFVATGGMDGRVLVWRVSDGEFLTTLEGADEVIWLEWHPKGSVLLCGAQDGNVWMWAIPSGNVMQVFASHTGPVNAGCFNPNGKSIVTVSDDGSLVHWDPKTGAALLKLTSADARFACVSEDGGWNCVAVEKDGNVAVVGGCDGKAKVVNLTSGNLLGSLESQSESIESLAFCDTLPLIASASVDGSVAIYDLATLRLRNTFKHDDAVVSCQFVPQTPFLTTCSVDGTVRRWDVRTGAEVKKWRGHQDGVLCITGGRDGTYVVSGGDDKVCLVWKL
ncbi:60S ribosomal subunit assembly or modification protein [Saitoella coloradoensis]